MFKQAILREVSRNFQNGLTSSLRPLYDQAPTRILIYRRIRSPPCSFPNQPPVTIFLSFQDIDILSGYHKSIKLNLTQPYLHFLELLSAFFVAINVYRHPG